MSYKCLQWISWTVHFGNHPGCSMCDMWSFTVHIETHLGSSSWCVTLDCPHWDSAWFLHVWYLIIDCHIQSHPGSFMCDVWPQHIESHPCSSMCDMIISDHGLSTLRFILVSQTFTICDVWPWTIHGEIHPGSSICDVSPFDYPDNWESSWFLDLYVMFQDLLDRKYKSESQIRELKGKLSGLEEEHHRVKQELHTMRKDNAGLDAGYHDQEKVRGWGPVNTDIIVMINDLSDLSLSLVP